ncbi:hypothetical protein WJX73_005070 [Symbiochloris irregularis]|uniref:Uncharacterized protein n=1 Tax=Symbiochloris irregularis TaxID=706552 RepID=A0AAW1P2P0_9CHLO
MLACQQDTCCFRHRPSEVKHLAAVLTHSDAHPAAVARVNYDRLVQDTIAIAQNNIPSFKMPEVHMTVWGLARLSYPLERIPTPWLDAMAQRALQRLRELPPVDCMHLSNLLWAYAKLGYNPLGGELMKAAFDVAPSRMSDMSAQNLCNLIWAPVTLDIAADLDPGLWDAVAGHAVLRMPQMSGQGISNLLWAFGKMGHRPAHPDFFYVALARISELMSGSMTCLQMALSLWALATLEHKPTPRFTEQFASAFLERLQGKEQRPPPQSLSLMLWSCAKLGINPRSGHFITTILLQAAGCLDRFAPRELANTLWALGTLRQLYRPDELRLDPLNGRLYEEVMRMLVNGLQHRAVGHLNHLAAATMACGSMQHPIKPILAPLIINAACRDSGPADGRHVCNIVWGLAALGQLTPEDLQRACTTLTRVVPDMSTLDFRELRQLQQADMLLKASQATGWIDLRKGPSFLSPRLAELAYALPVQEVTEGPSK